MNLHVLALENIAESIQFHTAGNTYILQLRKN